MESTVLSPIELRRYRSQIELPEVGLQGQEKLKQAKVIVIGAGGKGTTVLQNLAAIGVGNIGICDNYFVEEGNLSRQRLYGNGDLGKQKAIISKQYLQVINHMVNINLHNVCLSDNNIPNICHEYHILVDATDNFLTHYMINNASIKLGIPMVFGSVVNSIGMVAVFNYNQGPDFTKLYPEIPKGKEKPTKRGLFSDGLLINIIGTIMSNEVVKLILDKETELNGKLFQFSMEDYQSTLHKF